MGMLRSSAKILVAVVTVPIGVTLGVTGGAIAGAVVGGVGGAALGWYSAGSIVGENRVKPPKTAAQVQAEIMYAFMPVSVKEAVIKNFKDDVEKMAGDELRRMHAAEAAKMAPSV